MAKITQLAGVTSVDTFGAIYRGAEHLFETLLPKRGCHQSSHSPRVVVLQSLQYSDNEPQSQIHMVDARHVDAYRALHLFTGLRTVENG